MNKKTDRFDKTLIWGTHAAHEAWLNPDRQVTGLYLSERSLKSFEPAMTMAQEQNITRPKPQMVDGRLLEKMTKGTSHQGVVIESKPLEEIFVQDLIIATSQKEDGKSPPLIIVLDQITDPHNVGAILRSASAFGVDGIIMQSKHAPQLSGALAKVASGAAEHVPVAYEINLSRTLDTLRDAGFTSIGMDERGDQIIAKTETPEKIVLVMGAEGKGLRPKVKEHCDIIVSLPTVGPIKSLNVSNATAVALYALTGT